MRLFSTRSPGLGVDESVPLEEGDFYQRSVVAVEKENNMMGVGQYLSLLLWGLKIGQCV